MIHVQLGHESQQMPQMLPSLIFVGYMAIARVGLARGIMMQGDNATFHKNSCFIF